MAGQLLARAMFTSCVFQDDEKAREYLQKISKRSDVSAEAGKKKYGDVEYADETNKKYPLDTKKHVKAAWSYINMPKNAKKYSSDDLAAMKKRIKAAATKVGVTISEEQSIFGDDVPVTQSHYYIDGSLEDHSSKVNSAFRTWRKAQDDYNYRWASILGVFADAIIFYTDDWDTSSVKYWMVGYAVDGDNITVDSESLEEVGVKMVVTLLADDDEEDDASTQAVSERGASMSTVKDKALQSGDTVTNTDTTISADAAGAKGVEHSNDNPKIEEPTTAAEVKGTKVPDPNDAASSATGVEHAGDEGVSGAGGDNSTAGAVKTELGKVAEGTKEQSELGKGMVAVQSLSVDSHGDSIAYMKVLQSADATTGKKMIVQGIVTRGDILNGAGQVYPSSVWQSNMDRMNKEAAAGKFIGKLEHPSKDQGLVDAAIKYNKFWLQGADVWAEAEIIPTEPHGKNLQTLIESGVQVDFSSRGYGTFALQDWRGQERPVMQEDFVCIAFDAVWKGASTGSGVSTVTYQSESQAQSSSEENKETMSTDTKVQTAQEWAAGLRSSAEITQTKAVLLQGSGLSELGQKAYQTALDKCQSLEDVKRVHDEMLPILQSTFPKEGATEQVQSETYSPVFYVKADASETAPKNVGDVFQRLVRDLPDTYPGMSTQSLSGKVPNHFTSPKKACYQLLCNIARSSQGNFNGESAARGLLALEQGAPARAGDILTQSLAAGATTAAGGADGGGAPLSNYMIFPLIRRVFPMYIMNIIASIQPMDRPEGKIFYLDHYRVNADTTEKRIDLNTSSNPFNSSFAENATEGAAAMLVRLRLASQTVSAITKKLGAAWSIEEMQDLRAYHGLDAATELMGGVAREMALEWNKEVLDDMLAQATGASLSFGTTMPASGFLQQKDWDEYIWVYLQLLDNMIFSKRNGPMTDIICGMDAALALSKSMRGTFTIGGENGGQMDEVYPGTTFYNNVTAPNGSRYRIWKTNFWGMGTTNGSTIMGFRKGTEWSDTPYIWSPYVDYVTPMLTDPADFSQKQGIVSRAAKKVVVSDAIGTLTVSSGQGVVL